MLKRIKPNVAQLQWKYKWMDDENSEVYGPFYTTQMLQWKLNGGFNSNPLIQLQKKELNNKDDLMSDLLEDDNPWIRCDKIDFLTGKW